MSLVSVFRFSDESTRQCEDWEDEPSGADRNDFQAAAERAEAAFPGGTWFEVSARTRAKAIYRELREMDRLAVERRAHDAVGQPRAGDSAPVSVTYTSAQSEKIASARHRVDEGERRVAQQAELVTELSKNGHPETVTIGRELLSVMRASLDHIKSGLRTLEAEAATSTVGPGGFW